jgi:hypothetical protein
MQPTRKKPHATKVPAVRGFAKTRQGAACRSPMLGRDNIAPIPRQPKNPKHEIRNSKQTQNSKSK